MSPGPDEQNVANTIWGLATLGWQAAEGPMRGALEAAAVRVAPSMNAQNVARPRRPSSGMETATRRSRVAKTRAKRHVECSPTIGIESRQLDGPFLCTSSPFRPMC